MFVAGYTKHALAKALTDELAQLNVEARVRMLTIGWGVSVRGDAVSVHVIDCVRCFERGIPAYRCLRPTGLRDAPGPARK